MTTNIGSLPQRFAFTTLSDFLSLVVCGGVLAEFGQNLSPLTVVTNHYI